MPGFGLDESGVRDLRAIKRAVLGTRNEESRRNVNERPAIPIIREFKCVVRNSCIDAWSLGRGYDIETMAFNTDLFGSELHFVYAAPVDIEGSDILTLDPEVGFDDGTEYIDGVQQVYLPKSFRGFLTYGAIFKATANLSYDTGSQIWTALDGGIINIDAVDQETALTAKINSLVEASSGSVDYAVDVPYVNLYGDTIADDQPLTLTWETYVDPSVPDSYYSRLRLTDYGCPE